MAASDPRSVSSTKILAVEFRGIVQGLQAGRGIGCGDRGWEKEKEEAEEEEEEKVRQHNNAWLC